MAITPNSQAMLAVTQVMVRTFLKKEGCHKIQLFGNSEQLPRMTKITMLNTIILI